MTDNALRELISHSLLIDAHCHGNDYPDLPGLFETLEKEKILCLSSGGSPETIRLGAELNKRCPRLLYAAGIHPWMAGSCSPSDLDELLPCFREAPQIGEIGMDSVWAPPEADMKSQETLFRSQLKLACDFNKPVTLHTKGMEERIIEILNSSIPPSVLVHWFDGDDTQLKSLLEMGCYFSISPAVLTDKRQREISLRIPKDRLLPETDNPSTWPWLFGQPAEARQIEKVYSALTSLLKLPELIMKEQFRKNCRSFLLPC